VVFGFGLLAQTPKPQSPIPNPQSPIPILIIENNLRVLLKLFLKILIIFLIDFFKIYIWSKKVFPWNRQKLELQTI